MHSLASIVTIFVLFSLVILCLGVMGSVPHHHRQLLHQPFFPVYGGSPSPSLPPSPSPISHRAEFPFSSGTSSPTSSARHSFFFPSDTSPPSPPPPSPPSLATFPANISTLVFPPKPSHARHAGKLIALISSVLSAAFLLSLLAVFAVFLRRRRKSAAYTSTKSDSLRLFDTAPSDGSQLHKQPPKYSSSNPSSEFLYLGTLAATQNAVVPSAVAGLGVVGTSHSGSTSKSTSHYQKLDSPELRPLPPLPKGNAYTPTYRSGEQLNRRHEELADNVEENDVFFSPRGSSANKESASRVWSSSRRDFQGIGVDHFGSTSFNSRTASYPCSPSASISSTTGSSWTDPSSRSLKSRSPPMDQSRNSPSFSSAQGSVPTTVPNTVDRASSPVDDCKKNTPVRIPPPPPPLPPPRFWEVSLGSNITRDTRSGEKSGDIEKKVEASKPKLKPLHWDKVRASSSRVMVWDQIKSNSFQLNEEMIETLFRVNDTSLASKDHGCRQGIQSLNLENRVLDPRKSQNIAILLRALNVTIDEVCEALSEGNHDALGAELLECLIKMAPNHEEEQMLKAFNDESPLKLGPAERFLKAVLDIPFAFKRVDAMLYAVSFGLEAEHLRVSFGTLEAACEELRNTRLFLKLLEAVLKTGNRMNVGTDRGDAHAFKLDTLLKLVDVKGMDGKTTLLHFVVQEIIKSEGLRLAGAKQSPKNEVDIPSSIHDDIDHRKRGLQVVSGISSELINVKKAAAMDSGSLNDDILKLTAGIVKVKEVLSLDQCGTKFYKSMNNFLDKAQVEVADIQFRGNNAFSAVKEVTEYFHGNLAKEEAHPFRIFVVVRDFLAILDQACKEVAKINERTMYGSTRPSPPIPTVLPQGFLQLESVRRNDNSDRNLPAL